MLEEDTNSTIKPIDVKELFSSKSPKLAQYIPKFIYRYINHIMHINYINGILKKHGHLRGISFIDQVVKDFNVKLFLHGIDNIPDSGRFIFASNHPLGGFDGMLLLKTVDKKLGNAKFLTNDLLLNIPQLKDLFIPINKHGNHSRKAAKLINEAYNSNNQVLIFPSGLASRKIKGQIIDLEWKKHFISKSKKHKRDIIPVFISGRNSNRFYRLAHIRKFFRIKWNLEMFFLPDETMRHRNTDVHIYFGAPISHTTFNSTKRPKEWAKWVKDIVYNLAKNQH